MQRNTIFHNVDTGNFECEALFTSGYANNFVGYGIIEQNLAVKYFINTHANLLVSLICAIMQAAVLLMYNMY